MTVGGGESWHTTNWGELAYVKSPLGVCYLSTEANNCWCSEYVIVGGDSPLLQTAPGLCDVLWPRATACPDWLVKRRMCTGPETAQGLWTADTPSPSLSPSLKALAHTFDL